MSLIDFHTHHPSREGETVVLDGKDTWGIHPWHATTALPVCEGHPLAIGECGLDKACQTPYSIQLTAFRHCVRESERLQLPLYLHCVRAIDDCLKVRSEEHATQQWIWHGFRGKATQLTQLLAKGFYFSFGFHYNAEALQACPLEKLLLETDDDPRCVSLLYQEVASSLQISVDELAQQMQRNYSVLFG